MPKFEIYNDSKKKFRYRLIADNNQEICTSNAYATYANAVGGCNALSRNAADALADPNKQNIVDRSDDALKKEALAEKEKQKAKEKAKKEAEAKRIAKIKEDAAKSTEKKPAAKAPAKAATEKNADKKAAPAEKKAAPAKPAKK